MIVEDRVIGRVSGAYAGYKNSAVLSVDVRTEFHPRSGQTVNHDTAHGYWSVGISASVWNRQKTDIIMGGQIRDALDNMVSYAPGWNRTKSHRLAHVWDTYHLNDLTAACAHQVVPEVPEHVSRIDHTRWLLDNVPPCPVTGYLYGHAWLLTPLPASVIFGLADLFK